MMHAMVIDTSDYTRTKTDREGTILSRDDAKKNWEIAGSTTGIGAASGAVIGGGVGAVVGTLVGAGVGASHYMMAHPVASLPKSSTLVFQLTEPMSILPPDQD
jgi:outer membrane lipoprotein SlyB